MSYLVELVAKFPIDWHSNMKIFNFCHFSQKSDVDDDGRTGTFQRKRFIFYIMVTLINVFIMQKFLMLVSYIIYLISSLSAELLSRTVQ